SVISALDVSATDPEVLYYGAYGSMGIYRLDDAAGSNPAQTKLTIPGTISGSYPSCITVDDDDPSRVFVAFSNYEIISLYMTVDSGLNWQSISGNLEENTDGSGAGPSTNWISILKYDGNTTYYVGTSIGLFSADQLVGDSTVWIKEGANSIGNVVVHMVKTRDHDGLVAVATHGNGVYSNKQQSPPASNPVVQRHYQPVVYPNPVIGNGDVFFELKQAVSDLLIKIYTIEGKLVYTSREEYTKKLKWKGVTRSSGFFIYQLKVNGFEFYGKLLVIKP
ncbi:MAG: T9SS type A sorting domain-containing protein, partial [Bacteroidetes bacterium]|nr:T9SS type A sorting domain-containing protein [Bacteroidota bacterium]